MHIPVEYGISQSVNLTVHRLTHCSHVVCHLFPVTSSHCPLLDNDVSECGPNYRLSLPLMSFCSELSDVILTLTSKFGSDFMLCSCLS